MRGRILTCSAIAEVVSLDGLSAEEKIGFRQVSFGPRDLVVIESHTLFARGKVIVNASKYVESERVNKEKN